MVHSRKQLSNDGDRVQLEMGEARVLFATYQVTKKSVLTADRMEYLEKRYGAGCVKRIRDYMTRMKNGELE